MCSVSGLQLQSHGRNEGSRLAVPLHETLALEGLLQELLVGTLGIVEKPRSRIAVVGGDHKRPPLGQALDETPELLREESLGALGLEGASGTSLATSDRTWMKPKARLRWVRPSM